MIKHYITLFSLLKIEGKICMIDDLISKFIKNVVQM